MGEAARRENPTFNKTPIALVALFVDMLRNYFKFNSTRYTYSKDSKENKLLIESGYSFKSDEIGKRPAIYVKRGAIQFAKIVRGHFADFQPDGTTRNIAQEQGYITIMCLSTKPLEAEMIGTEVAEFLQGMCIIISREFDFLTLNVDAIGDLGILEEHKEMYVTPITLTFAAIKVWGVWQESVKLKKIVYRIQNILRDEKAVEDILNISDPNHIGIDVFPGGEAGPRDRYPEDKIENELTFDDIKQKDGLANYGDCE